MSSNPINTEELFFKKKKRNKRYNHEKQIENLNVLLEDAHQFREHPVGNAMPACRPFSDINLRTVFSKVSHKSVINIPGFNMPLMYFLT